MWVGQTMKVGVENENTKGKDIEREGLLCFFCCDSVVRIWIVGHSPWPLVACKSRSQVGQNGHQRHGILQ